MSGRRPGAGAYDQRVTVKAYDRTDDDGGGYTRALTVQGTVWARVEQMRGQERAIADREAEVQTYRVVMRDGPLARSITTGHVLTWKTLNLNVTAAPEIGRHGVREFEAETGVEV